MSTETLTPLQAAPGKSSFIRMDVPFLIRLMEVCRESVKNDATLHRLAERIQVSGRNNKIVTMDDYDYIMGTPVNKRAGGKKVAPTPPTAKTPKTAPPTATNPASTKTAPLSVPKTATQKAMQKPAAKKSSVDKKPSFLNNLIQSKVSE